MATGYDIVGVVMGVLGAIAIPQLIYTWLLWSFPTRKLKDLDEVMADVNHLFYEVVEQGLLTNPDFVNDAESHILSCASPLSPVYSLRLTSVNFKGYGQLQRRCARKYTVPLPFVNSSMHGEMACRAGYLIYDEKLSYYGQKYQ